MTHRIHIAAIVLAAGLLSACDKTQSDGAAGDAGQEDTSKEIGSSLNDKSDVAISALPAGVLQAAKAARPNVEFTEAEREVRNGVVYYDVAGTDGDGGEVEIDIMQDGDSWRVVEIQRDIDLAQAPTPVRDALAANAPGVEPARIIESDQTDGVIIYEFFTRAGDGTEKKYEIKFADGEAEFLTEEWVH